MKLRQKLRSDIDLHAAPTPSGRYVIVQRFRPDAWFSSLRRQPLFVSTEHLGAGDLAGMVETWKRPWWVRIVEARSQLRDPEFAYRMWEATMDWVAKAAPELEKLLPGTDPLVAEIELQSVDAIDRNLETLTATEPETPQVEVLAAKQIRIRLMPGFLALLCDSTNEAEKSLCRAIAIGAVMRSGATWSMEFESLIDSIFADRGARSIHFLASHEFRDVARSFHEWRSHYIQPEDREWSSLGLAWLYEEPQEPHRIEDRDACVKLLNGLVDQLWSRIRNRLTEHDRLCLVTRCIELIEANTVEAAEWKVSARAHLALYEPREEVLRVSREQEMNRAAAALASRIAIEMAVCESPAKGKQFGYADLDSTLADINELLVLANQSNAIWHGYADAWVEVLPSGRLRMDERFAATVVLPYASEFYDTAFQEAVASYEKLIRPQQGSDTRDKDTLPLEFVDAFSAEYGISPQAAVEIALFLEQQALDSHTVVEIKALDMIEGLLAESMKISAGDIRRFLKMVMLPMRQRWDEPRPKGFTARDWEPWRFRRRLSAIARPVIQIDEKLVVYSPGFFSDGLKYLITNALSGDLPSEFYRTVPMRTWVGKQAHKRGEDFNDLVLERVSDLGFSARARIPMSELGVTEEGGDFRQSDVDVLAWSAANGFVIVVECKRLLFAKTIGEIADQLNDFRAARDPSAKNNLEKHVERFNWLDANRSGLQRITGIPTDRMALKPLIVTNRTVPMQFAAGLAGAAREITSLEGLKGWISRAGFHLSS